MNRSLARRRWPRQSFCNVVDVFLASNLCCLPACLCPQEVAKATKPIEKEIIIDVPLAW